MSPRIALACSALALFGLAALVAAPAHASPLCVEGADDGDEKDDAPADVPERVILPCALADSAAAGGCVDAAVYVLTTGGVLLCQVDIPTLEATGGLPEVQQTPGAPAPAPAAAFVAALVPGGADLPPVLVRELRPACADADGAARDGYGAHPTPPS